MSRYRDNEKYENFDQKRESIWNEVDCVKNVESILAPTNSLPQVKTLEGQLADFNLTMNRV
jgi:hypothetical protein